MARTICSQPPRRRRSPRRALRPSGRRSGPRSRSPPASGRPALPRPAGSRFTDAVLARPPCAGRPDRRVTAIGARIADQKVVMLGAGSAGVGVCEQIVRAHGVRRPERGRRPPPGCTWWTSKALVSSDRTDLDPAQRRLAQPPGRCRPRRGHHPSPARRRCQVGPTALTPVHGGGRVHRGLVRPCRPGAPPDHHAAVQPDQPQRGRPRDLADWTECRALVATGSPVPADAAGRRHRGRHRGAGCQCNNVYIFPGIGLAVTAVGAKRVTDSMLTVAAARWRPRHHPQRPERRAAADRPSSPTPPTPVAHAGRQAAVDDGRVAPKLTDEQIDEAIRATRWTPALPLTDQP